MSKILEKKNIPKGWSYDTLGTFLDDIGDGGTPSRAKSEYFGGEIPWVVVKDIKKEIYKTRESLTSKGLEKSSAKLWPEGSVILSFGATIGEVGIAKVPVTTKQGVAGLIPNNLISSEYLYYSLLNNYSRLNSLASGSTIKEVRPSVIKNQIKLLLPPIKEQNKIAEILDTVDEQIQKTEGIIKTTEKLKKGLVQDLFTKGIGHTKFKETEVGVIPENWEMRELSKTTKFIDYRGKTPKKTKEGIPLITAKNVRQGYVSVEPKEYIAKEEYSDWMTRGVPNKGDVLFTTEAPLGYVAQIETEDKIALAQRIITIQGIDYDNTFLKYLLSSQIVQRKILSLGTGGTVRGIKSSTLKKMLLPVPCVKEQKEISEILGSIDAKIHTNKEALEEQKQLKIGLMQDLLSGEVRVKI